MYLVESVRQNHAEGVIFAMPSFCDPALLERPMLQSVLKDSMACPRSLSNTPRIPARCSRSVSKPEPSPTSIKLWSGA